MHTSCTVQQEMQTFLSPYDIATKKKEKQIHVQNRTLTLHIRSWPNPDVLHEA